ncbi:MAG TPA: ABC transporter permease [Solirubrobacteraceae bacterium]|nr:ABC transporter permease [Solirubrobacteraceae bacterium]
MLAFLLRRLLYAAGTLILTAFFAYGTMRFLRPEQYPGQSTVADLFSDVDRALLHFDFGGACMFAGCPPIKRLWLDGIWADLFLLAGGVVFAVTFGVLGGLWCASRRRTGGSRTLQWVSTVLYCAPVYVIGLGLLLLFAPPFGLVDLPYFFDPDSYAPPLQDPWDFVRSMLLPWIVVGAPLGAAILRLTLALASETLGEDFVRTAAAKGLPHARVVRRHAGPPTHVSVASLVAASAPLTIMNVVLVEYVFAIPGFFRHIRRALGQVPNWPPPKVPPIDVLTLQALALWAAVLIVALGLLADLAIMRLDPRIRTSGNTIG